jgi:hypothetical protein
MEMKSIKAYPREPKEYSADLGPDCGCIYALRTDVIRAMGCMWHGLIGSNMGCEYVSIEDINRTKEENSWGRRSYRVN